MAEYKQMKAEMDQELTVAEMKADAARCEVDDLEGLLEFAEGILLDPAQFWMQCSLEQKQRLQQVLFPEGVLFADGIYRTTTTCLMFSLLGAERADKEDLVALTGIEPVFQP